MGVPNWTQFNPAAASPQAILATVAAFACAFSRAPTRILRSLTSWPALAVLFVIATISVPMIILGYIAPCGAMQDTVAAGELLAERSAYPSDLRPVVKRVVQENPLPATFSWLRRIQSSHLGCLYELQLNAHPPLVPVALEPVVAALGYYKPVLLFQAISLASLVLMIWLWSKAFDIVLRPRQWLLFLLVLLGSEPVFEVLRGAGLSGLLAMLIMATWYLLRTERDGRAGAVLAIAASLKLFPVVAACVFLFKRVRAIFAFTLSSIGIVLAIVLLQGRQIFTDYMATAHLDVNYYDWLRNNYSLFANIRYFLRGDEKLLEPLVILVYGSILLVAGIALFRLRNQRIVVCDFGMAFAATLMCLFSPVVWTHYFIILFLPFCIVSQYSRWWESKASSVAFFLLFASVDGARVDKLSALAGSDVFWSLPTAGVLGMFIWLSVKAFQTAAMAVPQSEPHGPRFRTPKLPLRL
jgi:hypothetical protein